MVSTLISRADTELSSISAALTFAVRVTSERTRPAERSSEAFLGTAFNAPDEWVPGPGAAEVAIGAKQMLPASASRVETAVRVVLIRRPPLDERGTDVPSRFQESMFPACP